MTGRAGAAHRLVGVGLLVSGLGFLMAAVATGPGPRLVRDGATIGAFYAPPAIAGLAVGALGAVLFLRRRWLLGGAAVAVVLLIGTATVGVESVAFRLSRPADALPFAADLLQIAGELLALFAVLAYTMPGRPGNHRHPVP